MKLNRRQFLLLTTGLMAGCKTPADSGPPAANAERVVNAGPASDFAADGVYRRFCAQGFFVIRQGDKLFAISAICTHRKCQLTVKPDATFFCDCHGSTFDPAGHVTKGPARRDLPMLPVSTNAAGQLMIGIPAA